MTAEQQADVIVVGAGQAGCAAAQDLAAAGLSVLLLDRAPDKVLKPCAGGVTIKALNRYRFSIDAVVRERHAVLNVSWAGRRRAALDGEQDIALMTHRPELDLLCRSEAQAAGAMLESVGALKAVEQFEDGVRLVAAGRTYVARWLIAADGANSRVRRLAHGGAHPRGAFAIEGLLDREHVSHWPGLQMDFGSAPGGYGWLFPKGDHVNVGLYLWQHRPGQADRAALARYAHAQLGSDQLHHVQGYPLGTWGAQQAPAFARTLFVGDAAGMTEPLLGEGIYGALVSGQCAAMAILAEGDVVADYTQQVGGWREELRRITWLARAFYGVLPVGYGVLRHGVGAPLARGLGRGWTLGRTIRHWRRANRFSSGA